MSKVDKLERLSDAELAQKLKSFRALQITVAAIFGLIILAWLVLGYWRTNVPVFVSTVTMGITSLLITSMTPRRIGAELERRRKIDPGNSA